MPTSTDEFVTKLGRYLAAGFPLIAVTTHEERRVIEAIHRSWGATRVRQWSITRGLDGDGQLTDAVRAVQSATTSAERALYVMLDLQAHLGDAALVRALRDFAGSAAGHGKAMILLGPRCDVPLELEKDVAVLELPLPRLEELEQLVAQQLPRGTPLDAQRVLATAARGLTLDEASRMLRMVRNVAATSQAAALVAAEKRRMLRRASALELIDAGVALDDVGGLEVLKSWLRARVVAFRPEARAFGLPEPRGMLVCGVQGCGKSLVAKATSSVLALPLVRLDFASVFATELPETAMRQATRIVEAIAPVVLWVDEIEKGLAGDSADAQHARVFGDFLIWLQEKTAPVFVAATANEVQQLPPELARRGRFDEVFFVDLPAAQERQDILAIHLRLRGRDPSKYPVEALARSMDQYSGAEIEQVVIAALFRAYAAGRELSAEDLRLAASELIPLSAMYEEQVQALRTWAKARARRASADRRTLELFED